jgi:transposase
MSCLAARPASTNPIDTEGSSMMTVTTSQAAGADKQDVVGGVDTHADTIHAAAIDTVGRSLGDAEFPTTPAGYARALAFLASFGSLVLIGIEGTSSYGSGIARAAVGAGIPVREVTRPDRAHRRMRGKSDPIDAYQAAHAALSGRAHAAPKSAAVDAIRALHISRRSAVKAKTAAINQIHQLLITAPDAVREKYRALNDERLIGALSGCRPGTQEPTAAAVLRALKALAQRHRFLAEQAEDLQDQLTDLIRAENPHLLSLRGVGPISAAQLLITAGGNPERLRSEASFAALCGTAPVPASSGRTTRHRLSRGGDRAANHALHTIAVSRMTCHPPTKQYLTRQRDNGRSDKEILRLLKRALVREIYRSLTRNLAAPELADLRPARQHKNITITAAARALGTYPSKIVRTELGTYPDYELATRYRQWLHAA